MTDLLCERCGSEADYFLHTTTPAACNPDNPDGCGAPQDHHAFVFPPVVVMPDLRLAALWQYLLDLGETDLNDLDFYAVESCLRMDDGFNR